MWEGQKPPAPARVGPRESRGLTRARVPPRSRPLLPGSRTTTRRIRVAPSRTHTVHEQNPESRCLLLELILPLPPYLLRKVPLSSEKDVDRQRVRPETVRIE